MRSLQSILGPLVLLTFGAISLLHCGGGNSQAPNTHSPISGSFAYTGSMGTGRIGHSATLLPNGKVLIAGGFNGAALASAEIYDPSTGTFLNSGPLGTARWNHTATLLSTGKVLVAGGIDFNGNDLDSAELYDPTTGTFSATRQMSKARSQHSGISLPNGKVLLAGGRGQDRIPKGEMSAELYDPVAGTFTLTGSMLDARFSPPATLLLNGKILIAGGVGSFVLATAELYDPSTGAFSATGGLSNARFNHTPILLKNGKVLIAGGSFFGIVGNNQQPIPTATAEVYDPTTGTFSPTGLMSTPRDNPAAIMLQDGKVLIAGAYNPVWVGSQNTILASAELYDPSMGTFQSTGSMSDSRGFFSITLLQNGKVLVTGGGDINGHYLVNAELYDPSTLQ
jgi:hypothetical protein